MLTTDSQNAAQIFSQVFRAFEESSDEVQSVIREMMAIINGNEADEDEKQAALVTLTEALFPKQNRTSDDFYYIQDIVEDGKIWKVYGRKLMENAVVLDDETSIPYKSLCPVELEERIGIHEGITWRSRLIKKFPSVLLKGQTFKARHISIKEITT